MKILIWNIRGLGQKARIRQLRELIQKEQVEVVGIQETIKQDFSSSDLGRIESGGFSNGNGFLPMVTQGGGSFLG